MIEDQDFGELKGKVDVHHGWLERLEDKVGKLYWLILVTLGAVIADIVITNHGFNRLNGG
jgi:hypothetical protein